MELTQQVAAKLEQRINAGEFAVGDRLPGQRKLATEYAVSDRVVREAQSVLAARNRVRIIERDGVYVVDPNLLRVRLPLGSLIYRNPYGYVFNSNAGHWPPLIEPTTDQVPCPDDVAPLLRIDPGTRVVARRRVVGIGPGEPMQITTTYLPLRLAANTVLAEADTGPGGIYDRIEQSYRPDDLGLGPLTWQGQLITRLPTGDEADDLDMPVQQPAWVELRIATSQYGEPVAVDQVVRDSRRWCYEYELQRDETASWPTEPAEFRNGMRHADTPSELRPHPGGR